MGRPNYENTKGTPPERRQIRLFADYGRDYPLWENTVVEDTPEGPRVIWTTGNLPSAETYGLSTELSKRLRSWQQFWGDHNVEFCSWDSAENEKAWLDEGEEIARDLATEVSDFADVLPEFRT